MPPHPRPVLVVGASGLVGSALLRALGEDAVGTYLSRPRPDLRRLDARDQDAVARVLDEVGPRMVLFPAAQPAVDWCEDHPAEAREQNVLPALATLVAASRAGAEFVFFSSDYVFDGKAGPYAEDARPAPIQVYGRHKLEVEQAVLSMGGTVVRTTTVFGDEPPPGKNFVVRLVDRLRARERVAVPSDQISTPTWVDDLARATLAICAKGGLWHAAGPDLYTRDELARLVARVFGLDPSLIDAVPTARLGQHARRPLRGGLRTDRLASVLSGPLLGPGEALARLRDHSS
jgi:dTDP-4-dehydrorhamnose reductase